MLEYAVIPAGAAVGLGFRSGLGLWKAMLSNVVAMIEEMNFGVADSRKCDERCIAANAIERGLPS